MVKIGDLVVVQGFMPTAKVEKIWHDKSTSRIVIELDWGKFGKSKVYEHDENKVWFKYTGVN